MVFMMVAVGGSIWPLCLLVLAAFHSWPFLTWMLLSVFGTIKLCWAMLYNKWLQTQGLKNQSLFSQSWICRLTVIVNIDCA